MILRRYGSNVQSVVPHFESKALNEISFRRDHATSIPTGDFDEAWVRVTTHELEERADGPVHDATEQSLLDRLRERVEVLEEELGEDEALYVENEQARDWPKTRSDQENVIVEGENRLHFHVRVEPPLRLSVVRRNA